MSPRKRDQGNGRQLSKEQAAVAAMVAEARQRGLVLTGPIGLLRLLTKNVLQRIQQVSLHRTHSRRWVAHKIVAIANHRGKGHLATAQARRRRSISSEPRSRACHGGRSAQVRIPLARFSAFVERSIGRYVFPGHVRDAGQKRRSRSSAGPVQHGNAPPPAGTARSWWWTVCGRSRPEAHGQGDRPPWRR